MSMEQLRNEIVNTLGIGDGMYSLGLVEDAIKGIPPEQFGDFFAALMGDDHQYLKPLDRVVKVSRQFKQMKREDLFANTKQISKEMYDKFYALHSALTSHAEDNRATVSDDMRLFVQINYNTLRAGHLTLSKQELYVLDELGGGEWLFGIKRYENAGKVIDRIEHVVKTAITAKYLKPKSEVIAGNTMKMIGGVG